MSALPAIASPAGTTDGTEPDPSPELTDEIIRQREAKARSLANLRPWQKGQPSANPSGRHKVPESVVKLAQAATEECMQRLLHLSRHAEKESVQLSATLAILERAWGRAPLTVQLSGASEDATKFAEALRDAAAAARIALARGAHMPAAEGMTAGDMSSRPSSPGAARLEHGEVIPPQTQAAASDQGAAFAAGLAVGVAAIEAARDVLPEDID